MADRNRRIIYSSQNKRYMRDVEVVNKTQANDIEGNRTQGDHIEVNKTEEYQRWH
jgi:hypothetical protein